MDEFLIQALRKLGKNEKFRDKFISFIKDIEQDSSYQGSVRDEISKYLVDVIFDKEDFVIKSTQDGTKYKFYAGIGSKIAREFLLSTPPIPEYVWEPQTTRLLLHLSKSAKTVIVGGAYFGDQVLPLAKQINKQGGVVHAFDLNKKQLDILNEIYY